jgi:hypothetical protein
LFRENRESNNGLSYILNFDYTIFFTSLKLTNFATQDAGFDADGVVPAVASAAAAAKAALAHGPAGWCDGGAVFAAGERSERAAGADAQGPRATAGVSLFRIQPCLAGRLLIGGRAALCRGHFQGRHWQDQGGRGRQPHLELRTADSHPVCRTLGCANIEI